MTTAVDRRSLGTSSFPHLSKSPEPRSCRYTVTREHRARVSCYKARWPDTGHGTHLDLYFGHILPLLLYHKTVDDLGIGIVLGVQQCGLVSFDSPVRLQRRTRSRGRLLSIIRRPEFDHFWLTVCTEHLLSISPIYPLINTESLVKPLPREGEGISLLVRLFYLDL